MAIKSRSDLLFGRKDAVSSEQRMGLNGVSYSLNAEYGLNQ